MPTQSLRPKQAQPNARQQLKVQQLLIPEIEKLQHMELQAQQPLTINKPIKQIPKPTHKKGANRLEAPYTKTNPAKPGKPSPAELKKQKQEMLDWLNNVRIV
ncbi:MULTISPECIES: hypothetical protein [Prochlorococcus]|uniref:hypothetical protein n=1 Tax=Prochlorococcus TaxID=1218 RepID=UPI0007B32CCE|nr:MULTISPECIES: hypothetical protein [Prochlorococcus]KZR64644.1 hypothetical protein PMIT1312_01363 [Prochlorococcus marinus str. MIT 1312]KZR79209.1 hypothetical protein PMIT1327_02416 [Prochlorococcus marinus str. MIT 1327]NMO84232.1 hypothetical protein [Prochlorococcus sp. P1344]NMP07146.1 hypothetical protein [Prochlorococcus sp. P1361]NMP12342.1 hypothetical protein [Prochlorococcus sp.P1363]